MKSNGLCTSLLILNVVFFLWLQKHSLLGYWKAHFRNYVRASNLTPEGPL